METQTIETPVSTKSYTKQVAIEKCENALKDHLAAKILVDKYFLYDQRTDKYLEWLPEQMWRRVAKAIATVEKNQQHWENEFYNLLTDFKFVPAGRILYGLGNTYVKTTLKNCYVIGIQEDSIKGVFDAAYQMAETYKNGGGCGIDISPLRPKGSPVRNAARESTGSVSFMDFYSHITGMIGQKARIGALLICIDISHPDIIDFIEAKGNDLNKIRYANISIKITNEFMKAVDEDKNFDLRWGGKTYKTIKAKELWNKIIHYAWKRAEPGILFWDNATKEIPSHNYKGFELIATNPCAELFGSHGDSCNLGSIDLSKYVRNPFMKDCNYDFEAFRHDIGMSVRFLDNIITLEKSPMQFQQESNDNGRKLGFGVMGLADTLVKMRMKYGSDESLSFIDRLFYKFMINSYNTSCDLAEEKGPFPIFNSDTHFKSDFIKRLPTFLKDRIKKTGIRNISVNAIAPTGSISCVARCSSGIEPIFMIEYERKTNLGTSKEVVKHKILHHSAKEYIDKFGQLPDYFVAAHDIDPMDKIKMQGIIQKYVDLSISNTVNLAADCSEKQISDLYHEAWHHGCKGITVYREGSREGVLVKVESEQQHGQHEIQRHHAPKRSKSLRARVHIIKPNGKSYTVFIGFLKGKVYEVFALDNVQDGIKDGQDGIIVKVKNPNDEIGMYHFESSDGLIISQLNCHESDDVSLVTRLMSTALRHGTPLEFIIDQVAKSKVPICSFSRAISRALAQYINNEEAKAVLKCPKCKGRNLKIEGSCKTCLDCGWSACG